ncbi:SusC/RagA family TonB-linked outer membrane protein [Flavobacterium sediminis]|uniref:SusC/RagA family TonB-linked outer membrane protein n=1 Tax=Flavobacterium sediminis TaxID=2201181 RepID=A0A2U8QVQ0_9FLAO|nr:SusC/RagA family TonB-linked outer membrane protein [Flavobacterium sediminis]AWM14280.1 SusC/RagA family TonB-linked outer membrane protein [Flavobacterium sediminis]
MRSKFKWIFTLLVALTMQFSFAQEKTVTGVVTDELGPVAGANVVVKGTSNGTTTDFDGNFSIKAKKGDVLEVSYVGMKEEVTVGDGNVYNVTLNAMQLEAVEVVGALGIKRKADEVTSSYQVVKNEEITQAANPNVVQALAAKVSGLQINTASNSVNSSTRIVINGTRSITGNNQALVVIDNAISTASVLQSLPPEIIESVNVIKGAQGSALYGEQGSNGVILVTTKKGSGVEDKITVTFNSAIDFQKVSYLPVRQTRYGQGWYGEHVAIENGSWGAETDGSMQPVGLPQADGTTFTAPYTGDSDNIKDFFKTGIIKQNGLTVSAGSLQNGYALLSINRQDREFVVDGDILKRTNVMFKGGKKVGKFTAEGSVQYYSQVQENTTAGLYSQLLQTATTIPVGMFENSGNNGHWNVYYRSPYWTRDNVRGKYVTDYVNAGASLKYEINKNINLTWAPNVQVTSSGSTTWTNAFTSEDDLYNDYSNRIVRSSFYDATGFSRRIYSDFMINLDYDLTEDLTLKANIGNNVQDYYSRTNTVGGSDLDVANAFYNYTNVLTPDLPTSGNLTNAYSRKRTFSFFANVDLGYKEYLNLNITGRNDWSSVLDPSNNSYFYPGAGLSFIPTKAFENIKGDILNYAKVYGSFTATGNSSAVSTYGVDEIGVVPSGFPYGDLSSYIANTSPTYKYIKPERNYTRDFGLSLGFFKDRLTLDGQYYYTETKDLITRATASSTSGLTSSLQNIGELHTTGFNIDLGYTPIKAKEEGDFEWTGKVNFSTYKTIIDKVSDGANEVNLATINDLAGVFAVEGEEFPTIKGIGYLRDDAGNVIVDATSGNPLYTSEFKKFGTSTPDFTIGFTNSFAYKGVKLTAVCDYRSGGVFYSGSMYQLAWTGNLIESAENGRAGGFIFPNSVYEDPNNPGQYIENTNVVTGGNSYATYQTYFSNDYAFNNAENNILDATAVKVREIALSYTLPSKLLKNSGISSVTMG